MPTVPRVGRSSPPSSCRSVVLPEPEAPTMAMRSPARTRIDAPLSTCSVTPPWTKSLARSSPSSTMSSEFIMGFRKSSIVAQGFGRQQPGGSPGGIDGRQARQHEGDAADAQQIPDLDARRQIAHEVHACIQELESDDVLEPVHELLQIHGDENSQAEAG